jgi:hypothetical protein
MTDETTVRALPGSYSEMYPGRFLKADMLKGQKVTVTIVKIMGEDLVGENNKSKSEWVVKIKERPLELVLNKTNGFCLYRMFGSDPHSWIDKRITIYATTTKFGRETLDCIRIWGSPDISEDMPITVPQGRKKAWETVMHRMVPKKTADAPAGTTGLDPRILTAFGILQWDATRQAQYVADNEALGQAGMVKDLNRMIEEQDAA